jgi:hypothetical protein
MNLNKVYVCDIETTGFLDKIQSFDDLHVLSCSYQDKDGNWTVKSTNKFEDIQKIVGNPNNTLVFHNGISYDKPVLEKMGFEFNAVLIDTLGLSRALFPSRQRHGLGEWGEDFGVLKPSVELWEGLDYQVYKERCEQDCRINTNLWLVILNKLRGLYEGEDEKVIANYIRYINFKMECLHEQEMHPLRIDVAKLDENIEYFEKLKEEKIKALIPAMPPVEVFSLKKKPKTCYKKDGSLSARGAEWFDLLTRLNLPEDYDKEIKVITKYEEPNPQSNSQVKGWLFKLGWEPKTFKPSSSSDPTKSEDIPQIRVGGMLCKSVLKLVEVESAIEELDGLSVIVHRLGLLKSFKNNLKDGCVVAGAGGLTNTLRNQHRAPICNLPGVMTSNKHEGERPLRDGRFIRELIIAEEGKLFMGVDLKSLEDRTKQHFIYPYDPEYVKSMMAEDFDPHLDLAVYAGALTPEQAQDHKDKKADYGSIRHNYKTVNYSATYGIGAPKLAENLGCTRAVAKKLIEDFWGKNWAVKKFADGQKVVTYKNEAWIVNPLNNFRYWLKSDKDKFSTLNQGGATYVFDKWLYYLRSKGLTSRLQMHDEMAASDIPFEEKKQAEKICKESIQRVNKVLNLLRDMDCDVQFGKNYAEVH